MGWGRQQGRDLPPSLEMESLKEREPAGILALPSLLQGVCVPGALLLALLSAQQCWPLPGGHCSGHQMDRGPALREGPSLQSPPYLAASSLFFL